MDLIGEFVKSCQSLIREPEIVNENDIEKPVKSPFEPILLELLPFIDSILTEFGSLDRLIESTTRLVKHSIRIVPDVFQHNLVKFLQIVIVQFNKYPCSAFIYTFEFCLKEYHMYNEFSQIF